MNPLPDKSEKPMSPPKLKNPPKQLCEVKGEVLGWSDKQIKKRLPTDILLLTANDHEFMACYSIMENIIRGYAFWLAHVYFGEFGDVDAKKVRVALMKTNQGPIKDKTATINAVRMLKPKVVLLVGVCATLRPEEAKLGDVIISSKLATYDFTQVTNDGKTKHRTIKEADYRNMGYFIQHADVGWQAPLPDECDLKFKVHKSSMILCGPELVNSRKRRDQLAAEFKNALGLEMEGKGTYKPLALYEIGELSYLFRRP